MEENHSKQFQTKFTSETIPNDFRNDELKKYAEYFNAYSLATNTQNGSQGNISFRIASQEDPFVITAAEANLSESLKTEDFVRVDFVDFEKSVIEAEGKKLPSTESTIHFGIYRIREDMNAILQGHSVDIHNNARHLRIPEVTEDMEIGTYDLVESILDIAENNDFLITQNHGFISMGKSLEEAWNNVQEVLDQINLNDPMKSFEKQIKP